MALFTTLTPPTRAASTASGACTSGSIALRSVATKKASGGGGTTSTQRDDISASFRRQRGTALCRQHGSDDHLVRVHVGDGRDGDARRLDDVDGVDADARADGARRRGVVPWNVGRDDGGDDAAVLGPHARALPPGDWHDKRGA